MTQDGWTLVMLASQNGHTATVELLHRLGADVKAAKQVRRLRAIMRARAVV
jgi:hypothetical protein